MITQETDMSELTREQVEIIAGKISNEYIWKHEVSYWLQTDAALRAKVEALHGHLSSAIAAHHDAEAQLAAIQATVGDTEFSLRQQLAAMTQERDMARAPARNIITKLEVERDAANEERQRAVDSLAKVITAQATAREALRAPDRPAGDSSQI